MTGDQLNRVTYEEFIEILTKHTKQGFFYYFDKDSKTYVVMDPDYATAEFKEMGCIKSWCFETPIDDAYDVDLMMQFRQKHEKEWIRFLKSRKEYYAWKVYENDN